MNELKGARTCWCRWMPRSSDARSTGRVARKPISVDRRHANPIYIDGKPSQKLTNDNLVDEFERLIRQKAAEKVEADAAVIARG